MNRRSVLSLLLLAGASPALAGYLESDFATRRGQPAPGGPIVVLPPPPPAGHEVTRLLDRVVVHPGVHVRGLTVFPLTVSHGGGWPHGEPLTLREGLARGLVEIRELARPVVERARFVNRSGRYVFVLGGEVILGGKQNRAVRRDALLAPHAEAVLDLYCVQRGRWDHSASTFGRSPSVLPQRLRELAAGEAGQAAVWDAIREANRKSGVRSETDDFQAGLDDAGVRETLRGLRRHILPRLPGRCVGVVVARGHRIVGADVFDDAPLFAKLRDKVLDSYGQGVIGHRRGGLRVRPPTAQDAKRFLDRVYGAHVTGGPSSGVGRLQFIRGAAHGQALCHDGACLHLNLTQPVVVPMLRR